MIMNIKNYNFNFIESMQEVENFLYRELQNVLTSFMMVHLEQENSSLDDLYLIGYKPKTLNRVDITNFVGEIFKNKDGESIKKLIDIVYFYT